MCSKMLVQFYHVGAVWGHFWRSEGALGGSFEHGSPETGLPGAGYTNLSVPTDQFGSPKRHNLGRFGCQFCEVISTPRRKGFGGFCLPEKVVKWKAWREYFGDCSGSSLKS